MSRCIYDSANGWLMANDWLVGNLLGFSRANIKALLWDYNASRSCVKCSADASLTCAWFCWSWMML